MLARSADRGARSGRAASDLGRFFRRQSSEIAHFNRTGKDRILNGELVERAIQFEQW
jgi:hypothetical protein